MYTEADLQEMMNEVGGKVDFLQFCHVSEPNAIKEAEKKQMMTKKMKDCDVVAEIKLVDHSPLLSSPRLPSPLLPTSRLPPRVSGSPLFLSLLVPPGLLVLLADAGGLRLSRSWMRMGT